MEKGYRFLKADNLTLLTIAMKQLLQSKTHSPERPRGPEASQLLWQETREAQDPLEISTPEHPRPTRTSKPSRHCLPRWQPPSPGVPAPCPRPLSLPGHQPHTHSSLSPLRAPANGSEPNPGAGPARWKRNTNNIYRRPPVKQSGAARGWPAPAAGSPVTQRLAPDHRQAGAVRTSLPPPPPPPTPAGGRGKAPQGSSGPERLGLLPGPSPRRAAKGRGCGTGTDRARRKRRPPSPRVVLEEAGGVGEEAPPEGPPLRRLSGRRHDGPSATGTGNTAPPSDPKED